MINTYFSAQATKENKKLATDLRNKMNANFLEHAMYDINDALTSILALCDMEQMKSIPKVKEYIQHINGLLDDVQIYQDGTVFNISHVMNNLIDVVKDNFKSKAKISYSYTPVKALVESSQAQLEQILLYLFVELIESNEEGKDPQIFVKLHQKEKDVQITVSKSEHLFSSSSLEEFEFLRKDFIGTIRIDTNGNGVQVQIRLPLTFKKPLPTTPTSSVKTTLKNHIYRAVKSFKKS